MRGQCNGECEAVRQQTSLPPRCVAVQRFFWPPQREEAQGLSQSNTTIDNTKRENHQRWSVVQSVFNLVCHNATLQLTSQTESRGPAPGHSDPLARFRRIRQSQLIPCCNGNPEK